MPRIEGEGGVLHGDGDDTDRPDGDEVGGRHGQVKWYVLGVIAAALLAVGGYLVGVQFTEPSGNTVDRGFLVDMTSHHDQAVTMAQLELERGSDPTAKGFAMEVLLFQRQELGRFQNFKHDLDVVDPDFDPGRETMAWMNMATPLAAMPGMASDEELAQLEAASGTDADRLFLTLMQRHHLGGAHMADFEAEHGANGQLRDMASRMARNQRIEVGEYQTVLDRLERSQ